jgi:uncharacterized protein YeaO (DUF488 family)
MASKLDIKRVYEPVSRTDGARVLVDRVWPRGVSKKAAGLTLWLKDVAPSTALRKWFNHDPERWDEFRKRYGAELKDNPEAVNQLKDLLKKGRVTLLYSAKDTDHNQAKALAQHLRAHG